MKFLLIKYFNRQGALFRIIVPVAATLLVGVLLQMTYLKSEIEKNLIASSTHTAKSNIEQFKTLRGYYTEKVISKVKAASTLEVGFDHDGKSGMVPLPATMIHDLSKKFEENGQGILLKLYSDAPFPNRRDRVLDQFSREALIALKNNPDTAFIRYEDIPGAARVRVAVADKMIQSCVACHNSHPQSPVTNWKAGDVRGVLEVQMSLNSELQATHNTILKTAGFNGVTFVVLFGIITLIVVFQITRPSRSIVTTIESTLEQTGQRSTDLSSAAGSVSTASTQQAAAIEEAVASIEELTSIVKRNSISAKEAENLSLESTQVAQEGEKRIKDLATSMSQLSSSSKQIEDIINVIDDIAFQTNLLALNAAVEAARAGEQGKGFAVVAEAVRSLAQRSATAAKDISVLIKDSVQKIENGSMAANQSGEILQAIVNSTQKVADFNQQIAHAGQEQTQGITQIAQVMNILDKSTQQNAQAAEKTASSSVELQEHVEMMEKLLVDLKRITEGESS